MTGAEATADRIRQVLPDIKSGTLRFWGNWFGRAYDNYHRVVGSDATGDLLFVRFEEGEILSVWRPRGAVIDNRTFRIRFAKRVRWEWFYYGRPKTADNLYFEDFTRNGLAIVAKTNVDWYSPDLRATILKPSVEIL